RPWSGCPSWTDATEDRQCAPPGRSGAVAGCGSSRARATGPAPARSAPRACRAGSGTGRRQNLCETVAGILPGAEASRILLGFAHRGDDLVHCRTSRTLDQKRGFAPSLLAQSVDQTLLI